MSSRGLALIFACITYLPGVASANAPESQEPRRWSATLSIVARDSVSGEIGMAIKSRGMRAGAQSAYVDWRVGAAIAQAFPNLSHMPEALKLMAQGQSADSVVARLMAADSLRVWRQLGVVDAHGRAAAYTGAKTYSSSGHHVGAGYSVQGNSLASDAVLPAMASAFERGTGDLAARMMAALEAGQRQGGDGPGHGAAAIIVSKPGYEGMGPLMDPTHMDPYWIDLRVDWSRDPLAELRFQLAAQRARALSDSARTLVREGRAEEAIALQRQSLASDPSDDEMLYALAEILAQAGRGDQALAALERALRANPAVRSYAARSPSFKKLRDDPRFTKLVAGK